MRRVLVLPGDGVGPEVMTAALRVLEASGVEAELEHDLVGGASIDAHGVPLTEAVQAKAHAADAVLFGAVGGPGWDAVAYEHRPEAAIIGLRKHLQLFVNLRPAKLLDAMADATPLRPQLVRGLDVMIVREATGGIYFGEPRGIETLADGTERGINTEVYTTPEIERVARVAFDLARQRSGRVTSADKANVMESGLLWRRTVQRVRDRDYPNVALDHIYADNCAMQLVRAPRQFDVILTSNLFGDILSDLAAACAGSLGLLPSATLGPVDTDGRRPALYEPIHGSAPDIAGQGIANPIAQILSLAMLLRWSFGLGDAADRIEQACAAALFRCRTPDIAASDLPTVGTDEMASAVIRELTLAEAA